MKEHKFQNVQIINLSDEKFQFRSIIKNVLINKLTEPEICYQYSQYFVKTIIINFIDELRSTFVILLLDKIFGAW